MFLRKGVLPKISAAALLPFQTLYTKFKTTTLSKPDQKTYYFSNSLEHEGNRGEKLVTRFFSKNTINITSLPRD